MSTSLRIAGAPISWGVCEVPGWGRMLPPRTVLSQMSELGLRATELGPPAYLPEEPAVLKQTLAEHELTLVGGFLAVVPHDASRTEQTLREAEHSAKVLATGGGDVLVLAAATGLDGYDERPQLTDEQWGTLITTCAAIREIAAGHGLSTVLHPHVGTHVERGDEVERFLADSDLPLCLDTGHLLIGGTDPVELAKRHAARISHVHLKDVRAEIADEVRAGRLGYADAVAKGMYVPLGDGDVAVGAIVRFLHEAGYRGWYVLEQDTALAEDGTDGAAPDSWAKPLRDTARSIAYLDTVVRNL
jgi:inosose dehydratase